MIIIIAIFFIVLPHRLCILIVPQHDFLDAIGVRGPDYSEVRFLTRR